MLDFRILRHHVEEDTFDRLDHGKLFSPPLGWACRPGSAEAPNHGKERAGPGGGSGDEDNVNDSQTSRIDIYIVERSRISQGDIAALFKIINRPAQI